MGFWSSLFGFGDSKPATQVVQQVSKFPEELAPYIKEILGEAQTLYGAQKEEGYQPYTKETIAPFTPEEIKAQEGLVGLAGYAYQDTGKVDDAGEPIKKLVRTGPGVTQPYLQEALDIYRTGAEKFTPEAAQEYMSPYQRAVTDIEKREAQKVFERDVMPRFEKQAVQAGGMSGLGSRAAIQAGQLGQAQMQQMGDIEAKGLQKSYMDAQKLFAEQKARERQMAGDIGRAGTGLYQAGLADQGLLQDIGQQKRELGQSALDEAYYKFLKEQSYPQDIISQYSGTVYGAPNIGPSKNITSTGTPYQPSTGQTLLGLGLTGLNIYGMGGGFNQPAGGFSPNMFFTGKRAAGGGKVGMSDKNLGKYMEQGSGAISASNRDRLMRLYKSGLSGLPVVRRQAGTYGRADSTGAIHRSRARIPINIKEENISPTKPRKTNIPFMDQLARLQESFGVQRITPKDLRQIYRDEKSSLEAALKSNREGRLADFAERRKAREDRTNPMARFAANQKAIQALVGGEGGVDWVKGAGVFGEEHATLNEKQNALMNKLDDEEAAIKSGLRDDEHAHLIQSIKSNTQLQTQLLKLPESEMNKLLTGLTVVSKIEEVDAKIIAERQKVLLARWKKEFKLDKAMTEKIKSILDNAEKIATEPEVFKEAVKLLMSHPMFEKRGEKFVRSIVKEIADTHKGNNGKKDGGPTGKGIPGLKSRRSAGELNKDLKDG